MLSSSYEKWLHLVDNVAI